MFPIQLEQPETSHVYGHGIPITARNVYLFNKERIEKEKEPLKNAEEVLKAFLDNPKAVAKDQKIMTRYTRAANRALRKAEKL